MASEPLSRRTFLAAAAGAGATALVGRNEADIVDDRLTRKVTLAVKGTALSDLCDQLRADTAVHLVADPSVADEKVTLFCKAMPLREVMRQLARPFGYTWVRSRKAGEYRYELVQDLRSQLLEEELRNRDRNAALLALEQQIERYRPYLDLSPDEALARAEAAPPVVKELLTRLGGDTWGLLQMYARLTPNELAALRAGQAVLFSPAPAPGQHLLPPGVARGVLQSQRQYRYRQRENGFDMGTPKGLPEGQPLTAFPEARPVLALVLRQTDLGEFTLAGGIGFTIGGDPSVPLAGWEEAAADHAFGRNTTFSISDPENRYHIASVSLATGASPTAAGVKNEAANARHARDPEIQKRVTLRPIASCPPAAAAPGEPRPATPGSRAPATNKKLTTADVLEAVHQATGMPIVADYYTRLYRPEQVPLPEGTLFATLSGLADAMRLRWTKDGRWLQFRSATFYLDRLKEVPNRLLARWSAARQRQTLLVLDDLLEIVQLNDTQLDAAEMAEGARLCHGLAEWDLARLRHLRPHLRYLAGLTPEQRREMMRPAGLAFTRMTLAQQQQFLSFTIGFQANTLEVTPEDLARAVLRVGYFVAGGRQWVPSDEAGGPPRLVSRPPLSASYRERLIEAIRRLNPGAKEEEIVAHARPEPDVEITYSIGDPEAPRIRRRVDVMGGNRRP